MKTKNSIRQIMAFFIVFSIMIVATLGQELKKTDKGGSPNAKSINPIMTQTYGFDPVAGKCYWEATYTGVCDNSGMNMGVQAIPSGFRFTSLSGFTFESSPAPTISGWTPLSSPIFLPTLNSTSVEWSPTNVPTTPGFSANCSQILGLPWAIPHSTPISIRIYILPTGGNLSLQEEVLAMNNSATISFGIQTSQTITAPTATIQAQQSNICEGGATFVSFVPPISAPTTVQWYVFTKSSCNQSCPVINNNSSFPPQPFSTTGPTPGMWSAVPVGTTTPQLAQTTIATNILNMSSCYVARVNMGCFSYYTNVVPVNVCKSLSSASISLTSGSNPLSPTHHRCDSWQGGLQLNYDTACCATQPISWDVAINGVPYTNIANSGIGNISLPFSGIPVQCCVKYTFSTIISNACGSRVLSYDIIIDRQPVPTDVVIKGKAWDGNPSTPPPVVTPLQTLCYGQSATLSTSATQCASFCEGMKLVEWQESLWTMPGIIPTTGWSTIQGQGSSPTYFTNRLKNDEQPCGIRSKWYRVLIDNGECDPVWSNPFEVRVKPKLSVSIALANPNSCTLPKILVATLCYPASIQWFFNGTPIPGGMNVSATQAGNYYAVVKDAVCQTLAKSNVITVCGPPKVVISGPCGICPGQSITLTATNITVPSNCYQNCTFQWFNGNTPIPNATGSTLLVSSAGTYKVQLTCGPCIAQATHVVSKCPSSPQPSCKCEPIPNRTIRFKAQIDGQTRQDSCGGHVKLPRSQEIIDVQAAFGCMNPQNGACATSYEWYVNGNLIPSATGSSFNTAGSSVQSLFNTVGSSFPVRVVIKCNGVVCADCTVKVDNIY